MGIVVCLAMAVGLFLLWKQHKNKVSKSSIEMAMMGFLLLAGLWNLLWYGLRNYTEFWGMAALVSGVFMLLTALILNQQKLLKTMQPSVLKGLKWLTIIGLLASFLLYAITLVQLNLGMPIIR